MLTKLLKSKKGYNEKAITLIVLVVTIVIMLILAGITIGTTTNLMSRTSEAKILTEISNIKEEITLQGATNVLNGKSDYSTAEQLLLEGKVQRTVQATGDTYYMHYAIKPNAYSGMQGLGNGTPSTLKDVFLIDDNLNIRYLDNKGNSYGDDIDEKVLNDDTDIRFASKEFSAYISKISGVVEDEMKFKWMKNQTSLNLREIKIDTLEDLVFFPNLQSLSITFCSKIKDLNGIANCTKLSTLIVTGSTGQIIDFGEISKLAKLNYISITSCKISDYSELFSLMNEKSITNIYLNNNGTINDLSGIEKFRNLTQLTISRSGVKDITSIAKLSNLETLSLERNDISDFLELYKLDKLKSLNLKGNEKIDGNIDIYTGEDLKKLNKIAQILDNGGTIYMDVKNLGLFKNYKTLNLNDQKLTDLSVLDGMTQLNFLNIQNNKITLSDTDKQIIKGMNQLQSLYMENNDIEDISFLNECESLKYLGIAGNNKIDLKQIEDIISSLNNIRISQAQLDTLVNCDASKITKLVLDYSNITSIPDLSRYTKLTTISLNSSSKISDFSNILTAPNLESVTIIACDMHNKMVDFSQLSNLKQLTLNNNYLSTGDLEVLKNLNNRTMQIGLNNNSIIDATKLLDLNANSKIYLTNNVNLSQDSKTKLKEKFGNNVKY